MDKVRFWRLSPSEQNEELRTEAGIVSHFRGVGPEKRKGQNPTNSRLYFLSPGPVQARPDLPF